MIRIAAGACNWSTFMQSIKCFWTFRPWTNMRKTFTINLGKLQMRKITTILNRIQLVLFWRFLKCSFVPQFSPSPEEPLVRRYASLNAFVLIPLTSRSSGLRVDDLLVLLLFTNSTDAWPEPFVWIIESDLHGLDIDILWIRSEPFLYLFRRYEADR